MALSMSSAALGHVQQQLDKRGKGLGIRLGVKATGCSGLSYVLEFVDEHSGTMRTELTMVFVNCNISRNRIQRIFLLANRCSNEAERRLSMMTLVLLDYCSLYSKDRYNLYICLLLLGQNGSLDSSYG